MGQSPSSDEGKIKNTPLDVHSTLSNVMDFSITNTTSSSLTSNISSSSSSSAPNSSSSALNNSSSSTLDISSISKSSSFFTVEEGCDQKEISWTTIDSPPVIASINYELPKLLFE